MNLRSKEDIVKAFCSDPSMDTLCAIQFALQMSVSSSPFRGACGSDNKAFLAILLVKQLRSKLTTLPANHPDYIASADEVKSLYDAFVRRTLDQGEECVYDEAEDQYANLKEDYRTSFAGLKLSSVDNKQDQYDGDLATDIDEDGTDEEDEYIDYI